MGKNKRKYSIGTIIEAQNGFYEAMNIFRYKSPVMEFDIPDQNLRTVPLDVSKYHPKMSLERKNSDSIFLRPNIKVINKKSYQIPKYTEKDMDEAILEVYKGVYRVSFLLFTMPIYVPEEDRELVDKWMDKMKGSKSAYYCIMNRSIRYLYPFEVDEILERNIYRLIVHLRFLAKNDFTNFDLHIQMNEEVNEDDIDILFTYNHRAISMTLDELEEKERKQKMKNDRLSLHKGVY